jgi:hypothetical protein
MAEHHLRPGPEPPFRTFADRHGQYGPGHQGTGQGNDERGQKNGRQCLQKIDAKPFLFNKSAYFDIPKDAGGQAIKDRGTLRPPPGKVLEIFSNPGMMTPLF